MDDTNRDHLPNGGFGRIITCPEKFDGRPYLVFKEIEIADVLELIKRGLSNKKILQHFDTLDNDDIEACRAWQARFAPGSLSKEFNRVSDRNVVMLDENMSYMLLHHVARLFGRTSHVYADGLCQEHNDDEHDIWAHMIENKYEFIITRDSDFIDISRRYRDKMIEKYGSLDNCPEHIPAVILMPSSVSRDTLASLLEKHQDAIREFVAANDAIYATVTRDGLIKEGGRYPARHKKHPHHGEDHGNDNDPAPFSASPSFAL